jgi:hypothetical protein
MTERIYKLGMNAGLYVNLNGHPYPKAMSSEECEIAYREFAELIIQECIRIAELKEQGYKDFDPNTSVGWYIRKYFE